MVNAHAQPLTQPRYIAVEGPPGAGVGHLAARLAGHVGARLVHDPTGDNPFLQGFADDPKRFAFQAQLFFLLARYRQQGELAQGHLFSRGVITDYLFPRDVLWAQLTLSDDEYRLYRKVYELLNAQVPRPDLVVYLTAKPEVLRGRLQKRVKPTDRVVQAGLIDDISRSMSEFFFHYQDSPLLVVNTSEIDSVEKEAHLDEIVAVIQKTEKGTSHYNPGKAR